MYDKFRKDLTGMVFSKLTVLELDDSIKNSEYGTHWKCRCECGTIKTIGRKLLLARNVRSCGCSKKNRLPNGESNFRHLYRTYKNGASYRNLSRVMTYEDFKSWIKRLSDHMLSKEILFSGMRSQ